MDTIANVAEFVAFVESRNLLPRADSNNPLWYRGHADWEWELKPKALREEFLERPRWLPPPTATLQAGEAEFHEKRLLTAFRREGCALLPAGAPVVDLYFLAAHHGLPTRLLDWTVNALAALFFATCEYPDRDAAVIAFDPGVNAIDGTGTHLNAQTDAHSPWVTETVSYLYSVAGKDRPTYARIVPVAPPQMPGRLRNQSSRFTLHMVGAGGFAANAVRQFRIPRGEKKAISRTLRSLGVSWSSIYPDLDNVCREINESPIGHV